VAEVQAKPPTVTEGATLAIRASYWLRHNGNCPSSGTACVHSDAACTCGASPLMAELLDFVGRANDERKAANAKAALSG
jgi:hypothetical protein